MEDDSKRGLYDKYRVTHADGRELDGPSFVLRPDRDAAAWDALYKYACRTWNAALQRDIFALLDRCPRPDEVIPF